MSPSSHLDSIAVWFDYLCRLLTSAIRTGRSPFDFGTRLLDRVAGVILGIVLVSGTIVGNSADDFLGVVPTRQGALCVGPIVFRLAQRSWLGRS
jgi:hypothetical protein